jgi:uncharacterized protein (DUF952 family)
VSQPFLYHITHPETLEAAKRDGSFEEPSLTSEGFIHCSYVGQMIKTANRFYKGQEGLLILKIDQNLVRAAVKLEPAENGELFPHIYGRINLDAIIAILAFEPDENGEFTSLPADCV